jgi:hypothetical protein
MSGTATAELLVRIHIDQHGHWTWTIILAWLALQLPLAVLIGKSIKFGTVGHKKRRAPSRGPRYYPGVVWC